MTGVRGFGGNDSDCTDREHDVRVDSRQGASLHARYGIAAPCSTFLPCESLASSVQPS